MRNARALLAAAVVVPMMILFVWMLRGLLAPIALAALFAVVLHPLNLRFARALGKRGFLSPLLVVALTLGGVFAPLGFIVAMATRSIIMVVAGFNTMSREELNTYVSRGYALVDSILARIGADMTHQEIADTLLEWGQTALGYVGGLATNLARSTPSVMLSGFVFLLALYFLLRDGPRLQNAIGALMPFDRVDTRELFDSLRDTIHCVMLGSLLVGFVQAILVLSFFIALSVPGAFALFVVALIFSFIPIVGTTPITLGATLYLFAIGRTGAAIVMIVGIVIIGLSDNIVRPMVQARSGKMHPLLSLLSIFGGLQTFGAAGVFLGPVVAAFAIWGLDLYGRFRQELTGGHTVVTADKT